MTEEEWLSSQDPEPWRKAAGNCVLGLWTAPHDNYPLRFAVTEGKLALSACQQSDDVWGSSQIRPICEVMRDVFGNPFRPVVVDLLWQSQPAVSLARDMYESLDFSKMPILASLLDDAGCRDADLLAHCRGPGPHVRGCWVVDLVLAKELAWPNNVLDLTGGAHSFPPSKLPQRCRQVRVGR